MEDDTELDHEALAARIYGAWNTHDVDRVLACYTPDARYRDPSTRGWVEGHAQMRRYLTKLFGRWRMRWRHREVHRLDGTDGYAALWTATLGRRDGGPEVEVEGMDLVLMDGQRVDTNEVYFDRSRLAE